MEVTAYQWLRETELILTYVCNIAQEVIKTFWAIL